MLDRLEIPLMTPHNRDAFRTAYTVSVDARDGAVVHPAFAEKGAE